MTRLAIVAVLSLILAAVLCYSTLRLSEAAAKATIPRIEIEQQVTKQTMLDV